LAAPAVPADNALSVRASADDSSRARPDMIGLLAR
jgi:hypothetical protein